MSATRDPLPTPAQRQQLDTLDAYAFVEIRALCWEGRAEQSAALADAFHNVLREMHGWGGFSWEVLQRDLASYQRNWADKGFSPSRDYPAELAIIRAAP